jgi:hypothetical protein
MCVRGYQARGYCRDERQRLAVDGTGGYWPKTEAPSILPPGTGTWQPPGIKKAS